MQDAMDLDPAATSAVTDGSGPSTQKKRPFKTPSPDSSDVSTTSTPVTPIVKRLRSEDRSLSSGLIPIRDALVFDAAGLLRNLAFSQLYVTANFSNFNPKKSTVLLYLLADVDEAYFALCKLLPALYAVSPNLQCLSLTKNVCDIRIQHSISQLQSNTLPITTAPASTLNLFAALGLGGDDDMEPIAENIIVLVDVGSRCRVVRSVRAMSDVDVTDGCKALEEERLTVET